jgi:predicted DCC family thiol-disulfide oxidoreductase YuxK
MQVVSGLLFDSDVAINVSRAVYTGALASAVFQLCNDNVTDVCYCCYSVVN